MRTPSTPAAAFDAMSSTTSMRMSRPGKKRAKRSASSGTTSGAREHSAAHGRGGRVNQLVQRAGDRRAPGDAVDDLGEVLGEIEVRGPAIRGQAGGTAVELDGVVIEVARPDRGEHARRGRVRVAGVAQERFDRVVAGNGRLQLAEAQAGVGDVRLDAVLGPRQLAPLALEEGPF